MEEDIDDDTYPSSTTNVLAKQDFYWYDLLTKLGIDVTILWYSKGFVRSCRGILKSTVYRRLKKHAHNRRFFLGIEHEPYNEHRRSRREGKNYTYSEPYLDDGDSEWDRKMAKGD